MKTVATLVASVLLSLGMLTAPAHAEDAAPPSCEQTAGEWQARALAAEAKVVELESYKTLASGYVDMLLIEQGQIADANRTIMRLVKRENRHKAKIAELRKTIRELRTKQQR